MNSTPLQSIQEKINKKCLRYIKKLEKEKDEAKRLKLTYEIANKALIMLIEEIGKLSESQWEKYVEAVFEPIAKQSQSISENYDTLMMKTSKDAKEYIKYQKLKKISIKGMETLFETLDSINFSKKQLTRQLVLLWGVLIGTDLKLAQNNLDFYEFNQAGIMIQRRFGFDYNWLVYLALIQLHENLIKKRIIQLGDEFKEDDSIRILISKLADLIQKKEKREVSLSLLLSNGVKSARDVMTHEGYKHQVTKPNLEELFGEIKKLEQILYPENKNGVQMK